MKPETRYLNEQFANDYNALKRKNNSKYAKRTALQNWKARHDQLTYYIAKWELFEFTAETEAQKNTVRNMLEYLNWEYEKLQYDYDELKGEVI